MSRAKRLILLFSLDLLVLGVCLVIFSLFHHVLPRNIGHLYGETVLDGAPEDWLERFPDCFTSGEVERGEGFYRDDRMQVTVTRTEENGVTYYVADLYLRYITDFQTAMASEEFATGVAAKTLDMALENDALLAVSGDSFGLRQRGVVIRNGKVYRTAKAHQYICVLFFDGTMKTYPYGEFDVERVIREGAWQAWDFGPALLDEEGRAMTEFHPGIAGENPRIAIGYYEPGHYALVAVDGRQAHSRGMTLPELAELFEEMGCKVAYNLDGGGSAVMTWEDAIISSPSQGDGGREISDIIFIAPGKEKDE